MLNGFPQRDFALWVFMYPINIILFHGYHAEGYHAPSLPPRAITPVYASRLSRHSSLFYTLVVTPELSRSTTHVHRVITPATVVRIYSLPFTGYYATSSSPPTPPPGRHTYQPPPHASDSIERVRRALLSANEKNKN